MKEKFSSNSLARQTAAGCLAQGDVKGVGAAEGTLAGLMPRINMVAEQYPELKADTSFVKSRTNWFQSRIKFLTAESSTTQVRLTGTLHSDDSN